MMEPRNIAHTGLVMGLVVMEEVHREILNQLFPDLHRLPLVVTLIVIDPELLPRRGLTDLSSPQNFVMIK